MGRTLNEIYRVSELVGTGGFADVYLGRDVRTNTVVAIKILHEHFARDPKIVERFLHEATIAECLNEPHVVRVLDEGRDGEVHYIILEYVQGLTLAQKVKSRGPLPVDEAVDHVRQTLQALGAAHRHGIVHRDIKPQNIMVLSGGQIKVMDFGIAKDVTADSGAQTTMYLGTPRYMSPEQAAGAAASPRSDLYALTITLYEMLAGQPPFSAETPWQILNLQLTATPPPITQHRADVPAMIQQVLVKGLEKDPTRRFQSADEMLDALDRGVPATADHTVFGPGATAVERTMVGTPAGYGSPACDSAPIGGRPLTRGVAA
ncbi:MAG TPA: serine/threonine-protein kinase, partial [Chloroflexota bacterium]|nr:serine/threonine-protein kinase [Chloroflexota bacterium]